MEYVTLLAMKLTVRGEYALRALLMLARHYGEGVVRIQTISDQQNIPKKFLEQILNDLKTLGAVESRRGAVGGYRLARPPQHITLASVVRHIDGALAPVSCVSDRAYERCTCPDEALCPIRQVMKEVREAVVKIMERTTLADLCDRARRLEQSRPASADYVI
jgi:Rrf2 family protein